MIETFTTKDEDVIMSDEAPSERLFKSWTDSRTNHLDWRWGMIFQAETLLHKFCYSTETLHEIGINTSKIKRIPCQAEPRSSYVGATKVV